MGQFDGKAFTNENKPDTQLWLDYGKDYYAAISFFGGPPRDTRRIMLGWYSNWLYANDTPETTWRGAMAMPRTVTLEKTSAGIRLKQLPVKEFDALASPIYQLRNMTTEQINARLRRDDLRGNTLEIEAEFVPGTAKEFGVSVLQGGDEKTVIGVNPADSKVFIDRTKDFFQVLETTKDSFIPKLLPEGVKIANKPGELAGVRNDAGIIFVPNRPFAIAVMTTYDHDERAAGETISRIALLAYQLFDTLGVSSQYGRQITERNSH